MKRIVKAVQTGHNKWEKKVAWLLDRTDYASLILILTVAILLIARAIVK